MLQITAANINIRESGSDQLQEEGFIQLTMEEASALCNTLSRFVTKEAMRRQSLLIEQLKQLKNMEKTVFNEVAKLDPEMLEIPLTAVDFVAKFCPKVRG
ncbi:MAG: hypothetical protein IPN63_07690 [Gammaproteobacteria bacterium]|nr:hypothetical protein [Gammaproteobacteria bacterium]